MDLTDFVDVYASTNLDLSEGYVWQLRLAARRFASECPSRLDQLDELEINKHLKRMSAANRTQSYIRGRRVFLLTLWSSAADRGLCRYPNGRLVLRVRVRDRVTRGWGIQETKQLLAATRHLPGEYNGIPACHYWRSYVLAAWDSGLRGCDMRRIERSAIDARGIFTLVQTKTGKKLRRRLRPNTLAEIARTFPPERELIWPVWKSLVTWRRAGAALVTQAGLTGSLKWIRAGAGTELDKVNGRGHQFLGHTNRQTFITHYRVDDLLDELPDCPPEL